MTKPTFNEFVRKIKGLLKVADKYDLGNTSDLLSDDKNNYIVTPSGKPHNLTDNIKSVNSVKPKTGTNSITIPTISKIIDETGTEHNITKVGQEVTLSSITPLAITNKNLSFLVDDEGYTGYTNNDLSVFKPLYALIINNGQTYLLSKGKENIYFSDANDDLTQLNNPVTIMFLNIENHMTNNDNL